MAKYGPLTGQTLGGKYLLGEILGKGGFGAVYQAKNVLLNRVQAVKVIINEARGNHESNEEFAKRLKRTRERFQREARILALLTHPNILHIDDYGIDEITINGIKDEYPYIVMPFVEGGTLKTVIPPDGLTLEQTSTYLRQICDALDFAHENNVVHLDLKPDNILHQHGKLLLSDFGLAHIMKAGEGAVVTTLIAGTRGFTAPEQLLGNPQRASDIYSLGATLFCMVNGRNSTSPSLFAHAVQSTIPPSINDVIRRAMALEPTNRYPSAGALFNDFMLKAGLSPSPVAPPRIIPTKPVPNPSRPSTSPVPRPLHPQRERALQTPGSLFVTPHAQLQLDTPPPLDVMNRLLQEVGRQVKQQKGKEENTR